MIRLLRPLCLSLLLLLVLSSGSAPGQQLSAFANGHRIFAGPPDGDGPWMVRAYYSDPEMVREDVKNGLVSAQAARDIYKAVIDPKTFTIDQAATKKLRE